MITATAWVPRGFAAEFPDRKEFNEDEFDRIAEIAKLKLDDAEDELEEAKGSKTTGEKDSDGDNSDDEDKTNGDGGVSLTAMDMDVDEKEESAATAAAEKPSSTKAGGVGKKKDEYV